MIPARLLKQLSAEIAQALALVFKSSLDCGRVPNDWTMAHVAPHPLFKKGDAQHPITDPGITHLHLFKSNGAHLALLSWITWRNTTS